MPGGGGGVSEDRVGEEAPPAREVALTESWVRKDPRTSLKKKKHVLKVEKK